MKLVAVEITLENTSSSDTLSVIPLYAFLVDNNGYVYSAELGGSNKGQIDTHNLAPGEKIKGWIAYMIPEDATPAGLKYETDLIAETFLNVSLQP